MTLDLTVQIICNPAELSIQHLYPGLEKRFNSKPSRPTVHKNESAFWAAVSAERSKWGEDRVRIEGEP